MRYFLIVVFIIIIATFGYGIYIRPDDPATGEFCIGASIAGLFFIWMPFFLYHRWRNRDVKDYMLTRENIEKMRQEADDKDI